MKRFFPLAICLVSFLWLIWSNETAIMRFWLGDNVSIQPFNFVLRKDPYWEITEHIYNGSYQYLFGFRLLIYWGLFVAAIYFAKSLLPIREDYIGKLIFMCVLIIAIAQQVVSVFSSFGFSIINHETVFLQGLAILLPLASAGIIAISTTASY